MPKIILVCGTRPNFIKIAPIMRAISAINAFDMLLVHTGQHYDDNMSRSFFDDLDIPKPDVNLGVGSGSHAVQTAAIMTRFEKIVIQHRPDYVLVAGDVNSTIACGLVAAKLGVKLVHVEAGLRSFDRSMPEEINRILTDAISDILFVSERSGLENLRCEGIDNGKVYFVGNVMIDSLLTHLEKACLSDVCIKHGISPKKYGVVTLHRPSNVDDPEALKTIFHSFGVIAREMPLVFPVHPRTKLNIERFLPEVYISGVPGLLLLDPQGYLDFLALLNNAAFVMTDSGGIQEETAILGIPCMTVRSSTERPVTITEGTNRLVKCTLSAIVDGFYDCMKNPKNQRIPELWDGRAAERIAAVLDHTSKLS